jgi:hypothetical protein
MGVVFSMITRHGCKDDACFVLKEENRLIEFKKSSHSGLYISIQEGSCLDKQ